MSSVLHKEIRTPNSISRFVKNIFFPRFSERELITLMFLGFIFVLTNQDTVIPYVIDFLINIPSKSLKNMLFDYFLILLSLFGIYLLVIHMVLKRSMKLYEKVVLAFFFYLIISLFSIHSILAILKTALNKFDLYVSLYLLARSGATLLLLLSLVRAKRPDIFASQLNDEQVTIHDYFIILLIPLLSYFYFQSGKPPATAVIVSYFYTTITLTIYHSLVKLFITPSTFDTS